MDSLKNLLSVEENKTKWDALWTNYSSVKDFLYERFKEWILLYEGESFWTVLSNFISTHALEFKKVTYFLGLEIEQLGQISQSNTSATIETTAKTSNAYSGYAVDGDFTKTESSGDEANEQAQFFKVINNLELIRRNLSDLYNVIETDFKKFFITLF